MKFFTSLLTFLFVLLALITRAQDYFIVYDESCMDRLEYSYNSSLEEPFISYQIVISETEKIILEVGKESQTTQSYVPANFWRCDNANFDLDLIQTINQNAQNIFVVRRAGPREYNVTKVRFASYYRYDGNTMQYFSPKYRFEFDLETGVIGENISFQSPPKTEVYFEGRLDNDCSGAFIFRQYSEQFSMPAHTDIILAPEIGIVEERSGKSVEDAFNNTIHLEKVNGIDTETHLKVLCGKLDPSEIPTPSEEIASTGEDTEDIMTDKGVDLPLTSNEFHIVRRGETLYRIAKMNNLELEQLLEWNDLTVNSTIFPGDRLRIKPETRKPRFSDRGGDSYPAPYDKPVTSSKDEDPITGMPLGYDTFKEDAHIVKPGETMASIALKYGYTEAKFREMNGMSASQVPRIGQRLRTTECDCPKDEVFYDTQESEDQGYAYFRDQPAVTSYEFNPRSQNAAKFERQTPINRNVPTFYDTEARKQQPYYEESQVEGFEPQAYDFRAPDTRKTHTVAEGETIFTIARKYNLTVEQIRKWNGLEKSEIVIPFQRLYVEQ